jgi:hypothetical protein
MRRPQSFTKNKQVVRDLQCESIQRFCGSRLGQLSYFGLPSSSLEDIRQWATLLKRITAVERGESGKEWELQHDLEFRAFQLNLSEKLDLLRGDIDQIILDGKDASNKTPQYPYDIVSLDYSGGLFYRSQTADAARLHAFDRLLHAQQATKSSFLLFISCNLHAVDQGEIKRTLRNIQTELLRYGDQAQPLIDAYLNHSRDEARLKLYVPYLLSQLATKHHFNCETEPVIIYPGNSSTSMMAFRFRMTFDSATISIRFPRERLSQLINSPLISIEDGRQTQTMLGLPSLRANVP